MESKCAVTSLDDIDNLTYTYCVRLVSLVCSRRGVYSLAWKTFGFSQSPRDEEFGCRLPTSALLS